MQLFKIIILEDKVLLNGIEINQNIWIVSMLISNFKKYYIKSFLKF